MTQWIKCSERLPDEYVDVLFLDSAQCFIGHHIGTITQQMLDNIAKCHGSGFCEYLIKLSNAKAGQLFFADRVTRVNFIFTAHGYLQELIWQTQKQIREPKLLTERLTPDLRYIMDVRHWMPLPEPPEDEG